MTYSYDRQDLLHALLHRHNNTWTAFFWTSRRHWWEQINSTVKEFHLSNTSGSRRAQTWIARLVYRDSNNCAISPPPSALVTTYTIISFHNYHGTLTYSLITVWKHVQLLEYRLILPYIILKYRLNHAVMTASYMKLLKRTEIQTDSIPNDCEHSCSVLIMNIKT